MSAKILEPRAKRSTDGAVPSTALSISLVPLITEAERVLQAAVAHFGLQVAAERIVVTIQAAGRRQAYGWFANDRWQGATAEGEEKPAAFHEINISAEHIKTCDVGELLLHELAHAENKQRGVRDCAGQRHNRRFKTMAEALGLIVEEPTGPVGYGETKLGERGKAFLEKCGFKAELFAMARLEFAPQKAPGSRLVKIVCAVCGYTARVTRKWIARGLPTCPTCAEKLADEEADGEDEGGEEGAETDAESPQEEVSAGESPSKRTALVIRAIIEQRPEGWELLVCSTNEEDLYWSRCASFADGIAKLAAWEKGMIVV